MKIALDAAAGDSGIAPNIEGAVHAANSHGISVILVGPGADIRAQLSARGISGGDARFEIVEAREVISMGEDASVACRSKPHCSIMAAAELVASGRASAMVSAGNSGATLVAALWHLKRLPGVLRPAIAVPIPTVRGLASCSTAAHTECKPWHLLQFATMGVIYAKTVLKVADPLVGILSAGEEEVKGNELVREALPLLKCGGLRFHGPIEGRDLAAGTVDVVVCDGFVGNIAAKAVEGTAAAIFSLLKAAVMKDWPSKLGGTLLKGALADIRRKMSYEEYGGAPLLGVNGTVVIAPGRSGPKAIANALGVAKALAAADVNGTIRKTLEEMKVNLEVSNSK